MERIEGVQSLCCLKLSLSRATKVPKRGNITHFELSSDCHKMTLNAAPSPYISGTKIATIVPVFQIADLPGLHSCLVVVSFRSPEFYVAKMIFFSFLRKSRFKNISVVFSKAPSAAFQISKVCLVAISHECTLNVKHNCLNSFV